MESSSHSGYPHTASGRSTPGGSGSHTRAHIRRAMDELEGQACLTPKAARRMSQQQCHASPSSLIALAPPNSSSSPLVMKKHRWQNCGQWAPPPSPPPSTTKSDCVGKCVLCLLINAIFVFGIFIAFAIGHWASEGRLPWVGTPPLSVSLLTTSERVKYMRRERLENELKWPVAGGNNFSTNLTPSPNNAADERVRAASASLLHPLHKISFTNSHGSEHGFGDSDRPIPSLNTREEYALQRGKDTGDDLFHRMPTLHRIYPPMESLYVAEKSQEELHTTGGLPVHLGTVRIEHGERRDDPGVHEGHLIPLPKNVSPTHYELHLDFTELQDQHHIRGNASIALESFGNSTDDELIFHAAANIFIHRIRLKRKGANIAGVEFYDSRL